jgi:hypothetical protein
MVYTIDAIKYSTIIIDLLADFVQYDRNTFDYVIYLVTGNDFLDFRISTIVRVFTEINLSFVCLLEFNYYLYLFNCHKVI